MIEPVQLLHNMSAPPKSVVKYKGLSRGAATAGADGVRVGGGHFKHDGVFGVFVAFRLPEFMRRLDPGSILNHLGVENGADPEETLLGLIKIRSRQLALPGACVVVPTKRSHPRPWPDPLAALAIITKSSASIWLRSKTPRLSAIRKSCATSLLVPPNFAAGIEELSK